jgi:hypothetical protein
MGADAVHSICNFPTRRTLSRPQLFRVGLGGYEWKWKVTAQWASDDSKHVQTGHFLVTEGYDPPFDVVLGPKGGIDEDSREWEFTKLGRDDIATSDANLQSNRELWCI